jgi:N-acetyl-anhydromuramyl-L-alanine amidase AmpD
MVYLAQRLGYGLDGSVFDSWQRQEIVVFPSTFRPTLRPTQTSFKLVQG